MVRIMLLSWTDDQKSDKTMAGTLPTYKMKSNRRVVLVCDWQTSYSKSAHDSVLDRGVGKRPSTVEEEGRARACGQTGASFQYAADKGEGRRRNGFAVDEVLSFYTCGAISILFRRTISDSLFSSSHPFFKLHLSY